jgi:hypothetical protein
MQSTLDISAQDKQRMVRLILVPAITAGTRKRSRERTSPRRKHPGQAQGLPALVGLDQSRRSAFGPGAQRQHSVEPGVTCAGRFRSCRCGLNRRTFRRVLRVLTRRRAPTHGSAAEQRNQETCTDLVALLDQDFNSTTIITQPDLVVIHSQVQPAGCRRCDRSNIPNFEWYAAIYFPDQHAKRSAIQQARLIGSVGRDAVTSFFLQ